MRDGRTHELKGPTSNMMYDEVYCLIGDILN
jgi:hypothetical protein